MEVQVQNKIKELHNIQVQASPDSMAAEAPVKTVLNELLAQEEMKWRQRAEENWLRGGTGIQIFPHVCKPEKPL